MIINEADNVMYGDSEVLKVYCGDALVWERGGGTKSLSEYSITTQNSVDINHNISLVGSYYTDNNAGGLYDGYYDVSMARSYNGVSILCGADTPPCMFIPSGVTVYQNGAALPQERFYWLIDDNLVYTTTLTVDRNMFVPFIYYNSGGMYAFGMFKADSMNAAAGGKYTPVNGTQATFLGTMHDGGNFDNSIAFGAQIPHTLSVLAECVGVIIQ